MNEKIYTQSDLACERTAQKNTLGEGVEGFESEIGGIHVSRLQIGTPSAARRLEQPMGEYVTLACERIDRISDGEKRLLSHMIARELVRMSQRLTKKERNDSMSVFVAGLGNAELTPDAIGPKTVHRLTATRHLREHEGELFKASECAEISALAPGVLGQTGIETLELLRGAVQCVKPDLVLVIDALAARSCDRLASTVQLSDVGICPGSGVGNHRRAINRKTLGVPVISIGVPTVVNSSTLVYDALYKAGIHEINESLERVLENGKSFFVSPKESDGICHVVAALLSSAIEHAFAGHLAETLSE